MRKMFNSARPIVKCTKWYQKQLSEFSSSCWILYRILEE